MYFESRVYREKQVSNAAEAAAIIKDGQRSSCEAISWAFGSKKLVVVDDSLDHDFLEVAVLEVDGENAHQVESITAGWVDSKEELERYFQDCETDKQHIYRKVILNLNEPKADTIATFTCGCCGERFKGNVKKQLEYDQDAGYGICDSCA